MFSDDQDSRKQCFSPSNDRDAEVLEGSTAQGTRRDLVRNVPPKPVLVLVLLFAPNRLPPELPEPKPVFAGWPNPMNSKDQVRSMSYGIASHRSRFPEVVLSRNDGY